MSLKNLFDKKVVSAKTLNDFGSDAESADNIIVDRRKAEEFVPPIDFSSASSFATYGSAEKYYTDAVTRIYEDFPYDGSEKEINQFLLTSSYLDKYVLEKKYPRTNGHALLSAEGWGSRVDGDDFYGSPGTSSYEYIYFKGGPHTTLAPTDDLRDAFSSIPERDQNNVLDVSKGRGNNLALNPSEGSTVEFWMKKDQFMGQVGNVTRNEVILDIWNQEATGSSAYGRLRIELDNGVASTPFKATYRSGSSGLIDAYLGGDNSTRAKIEENNWNHYAITFLSSSNSMTAELYVNGALEDATSSVGSINEITGTTLTAYIGALQAPVEDTSAPGTTSGGKGWGKLSASLDEFRYWKTARTGKGIGRNYWTQVRGGTNTDDANTDLGVYFKFNEGITGDADIDSTVLDYSGRISNGSWTGYNTSARSIESAIVLAGAADAEFKDPIIYEDHPDVAGIKSELRQSGSLYDYENNASLLHSLPAWIVESDSSGDVKNLTQIIASYFDKLQNQIKYIPQLKDAAYLGQDDKPYPFASSLVESAGLLPSDVFVDATVLESILDRDEDRNFSLELDDIKNQIYQNIYNNIVYIYKSKGTEKSFRNLIHCYGVDDQLIRVNTYGNNVTYELRDNFRTTAVAKNVVDFSENTSHGATIYQYTASSNTNAVSFISGTAGGGGVDDLGSEDYVGFTLESEIIFPLRLQPRDTENYVEPGFKTVSLFGMHSANPEIPGSTQWATNDYSNIQIHAIRPEVNSKDVRFRLQSSVAGIPTLTTDLFKDVYDNNKWNFAVRLINEKQPLGDFINGVATSGSTHVATPYRIEFYGVNTDTDIVRDQFELTGTISNSDGINALRSAKRVYAGAHRTNFTGSIREQTDIKLSSVRYWSDYVPNEVIRAHARDTENYGTLNPFRSAFLTEASSIGSYIPEIETLALNWNFYNLTGSNTSGQFIVEDYSSGSVDLQIRYGWLGNILEAQHTGIGNFFSASSDTAIKKDYINVARQVQPEIVQTSEMINILSDDTTLFGRNQRPINHYLSIEKSMYQTISDEMINLFATIVEFNNLIGDPINRYRQEYKGLEKARQIFFENVENTPDLDKFIDFYKWLDSSLSSFLQQLVPAAAKSSDEVRTIVESHVLERNKYWSKFPTIDTASPDDLEGTALGSGVGEGSPPRSLGLNNPIFSSFPISGLESEHASYWRMRASRTTGILSSGDADVDSDRETIRAVLESGFERDKTRPYKDNITIRREVHGGTNYPANKNRSLIFNATYPNGPIATSGTPLNVLLVDNIDVDSFKDIDDVTDPNEKKFYSFKTTIRRADETGVKGQGKNTYESVIKGTLAAPFNLLSGSSVTSGYNKTVINNFKSGSQIVNLHSDTTSFDNVIPMQGPFTQTHVGGHQSRHVSINRFDSAKSTINSLDDYTTREEAWQILMGNSYGADNTFLGFVGADYPFPVGPYPLTTRRTAARFREEFAKRPVNIRNIKHATGSTSLGNYDKEYQIIQTGGRTANNRYFTKNDGIKLPLTPINLRDSLPATTTLSTLLGLKHGSATFGNYFGVKYDGDSEVFEVSNRYEVLGNFETIDRTDEKSSTVIVSRFSAPGGPEVNTLGYLDIAAAEKSVYNALPFRNLAVASSGSGEDETIRVQDHLNRRRGLRSLLSSHAGQFGHDSNYGSIVSTQYVSSPSYHKTNRNRRERLRFSSTGDYSGTIITGSAHDNAYVTRPIPRSDIQYSWIRGSYQASRIFGHAWNDSVVSSSMEGFPQAIDFAEKSDIIQSGVSVDFANLNTLIYDPLNTSTNTLTAPNQDFRNTKIGTLDISKMLNALLLHRNGPYGLSSWKQIRTGENPVARSLRKRNLISFVEKAEYNYPLYTSGSSVPKSKRRAVSRFTEAPISTKYKPISQKLVIKRRTADGREIEKPVTINTSYGNNLSFFNNSELNNSYDVRQNTRQLYDRVKELYLNDQTGNPDSPIQDFISLSYKETIYPAATNMFSGAVRGRPNYRNSFWRSLRESRTQNDIKDLLAVSTTTINQSMWPLDADSDFLTREISNRSSSVGAAGVLQNNYSQINSSSAATNLPVAAFITSSIYYSRRHTTDTIGSLTSPAGGYPNPEVPSTRGSIAGGGRFKAFVGAKGASSLLSVDPVNGDKQFFGGQTLWEAADQSGKEPWYDNYNDYIKEMRLVGKDYSIIPSFRISEHVETYMKEKNGDFLADNPTFLEITGGAPDSNKSNMQDFYKVYTNSDFLKFFEVVRDDHSDIASPKTISLQCKALKKFIPYDGFYPAARMVQLAEQFSASYMDFVNFTGTDSTYKHSAMRAFMAPFFAPGIHFNTIKSGVAVDYPVFSASIEYHDLKYKANFIYSGRAISGSSDIGRFHYRIPFEAVIEPEKYIVDKDIVDMEPHPSCSIDVTASWGGRGDNLYKMMANNFYAEVPEFFLPQQQFASLVSKPESSFGEVQQSEKFAARIKMYKSLNVAQLRTGSLGYRNPIVPYEEGKNIYETFTMYSRPTAFGPPCGGGEFIHELTALDGMNTPFTPPYYNGECWADIVFTAPRTSTPDKPITLQDIFSPNNLAVAYKRIGDAWDPNMKGETMYVSGNVEFNSMQLDASLNLFGKAQLKDLRYDPATGKPIEALDGTENVWVIQPKMETPMLNFSGSSITLPQFGSASAAVGMWHQYGGLPDDPSKGVFLQVTDMPQNYIAKALGGDPDLTGSLVDLVGFKTEPVRLGQVANSKKVKEAVVAVPFVLRNGQREFFGVTRQLIESAERIVDFGEDADLPNGVRPGQSIITMVKAMKEFVFPPKMDFILNSDSVDPFSMYIFEFEHTFSQQDLVDMWQNLSPKIGYSLDTDVSFYPPTSEVVSNLTIEHDLISNELLSGRLDSKIQWMVFKVKQKANKNYFSKIIAEELNQIGNFDRTVGVQVGRDDSARSFQPKYSYNWPYDFFSLVELVKIDAEVALSSVDEE